MHLVETYATHTGLKIDKPFIMDKYYPLDVDKYITLQPASKPSRTYDYWQTVFDLIFPVLDKENINVIQLGEAGDRAIKGCNWNLAGSTTVNQAAYLIKNSLMHVGTDSFGAHIAGHYDKKMTIIYPVCNLENSCPYWGEDDNKDLIIPPNPEGIRPSYSADEDPKTINKIPPERIAKSICNHLGLEFEFPYETVYIGDNFQNRTVESVPNRVVDPNDLHVTSMIVRYDIWPFEKGLQAQLEKSPCSIVTNVPINVNLLKYYKDKILTIIYIIEDGDEPEFAYFLERSGFNYSLISRLPKEEIDNKKLNYMDLDRAAILESPVFKKEEMEELKDIDIDKLFYMSSCTILSDGKAFASKADITLGDSIEIFSEIKKVKDHPHFWQNLKNFLILKKLD